MTDVLDFLDGREYSLHKVAGRFRVESGPGAQRRLYHEATPEGRGSPHYQEWRRKLGDDYVSDLTNDPERYCAIAVELGFREEGV